MSVNLSPVAGAAAQFLDNSGNVLTGGKLYTYAAGTTTPQATYTSSLGVTFHSNPIILDAAGRVPAGGEIWLLDGAAYKFVLKDANDVLIATWDNLSGINSNFVNYTVQEEIQTATAGQTVFTLTTVSYAVGTNSLTVFVDGVNQYDGATYAYIETDSTTVTFTAGLHVGALVKFTTAVSTTGTATNASVVVYDPPFTGGVSTTVQDKLAQIVSVKDFGAVGDGVTDDTAAIQAAIAEVDSNLNISQLIFDGVFLVNYLTAQTLCTITRDNLIITGGGTIKASAQAYSAGVANGDFKYYTTFNVTGNNVTIQDITIDGNSQFSQYASSNSLPNYWLNGIYFLGTDYVTLIDSPQASNIQYINGGGWPIRGTYCFGGNISNCYVENSQGVGFDGSSICVLSGNTSYNAYDAHFATWNSIGATIVGNTCNTSSNGSGVDVSGSKDCTISSNTIRACANRGIWVLQDPNTGRQPSNVTIVGNTFFNNNSYTPISEKGDIQVSTVDPTTDTRPVGTVDVNGLTIIGNTFTTYNGANSITLGKYAFNVLIDGNTFKSDPTTPATRAIVFYNSNQAVARNNNDLIYAATSNPSKVLGAGPVYYDGVSVPLDTLAAINSLGTVQKIFVKETNRSTVSGKKHQIDERFGYAEFGAEFNSANGSVNVVDIGFTSGGFQVADIELIVTVGGDRGVRRTRVTYQGTNASTPTQIVAAADEYSGGTTPPTIAFTASTGKVRISVGSNNILESSIWMRVSGTAGTVPNITPLV